MRKIYVTSDSHYNHRNILTFETSTRGLRFKDVDQMNKEMIDRWNAVVNHVEIVYHLGDVYFGPQ